MKLRRKNPEVVESVEAGLPEPVRFAVAAEGERRLAEATQRFEAERAGLERQVAETRSEAEEWVAGLRETHEELGRELDRERTRSGDLEVRLEESAGELEQATSGLASARAELRQTREQATSDLERVTAELERVRDEMDSERQRSLQSAEEADSRLASARSRVEARVAEAREGHDQLGRQLEQERTRSGQLEARLQREAQELEQARAEVEHARAELAEARAVAEQEGQRRQEVDQRLEALVELEADARESREQRVQELESALVEAHKASRAPGAELPRVVGGGGEEHKQSKGSEASAGEVEPSLLRRADALVSLAAALAPSDAVTEAAAPGTESAGGHAGRRPRRTEGICSVCNADRPEAEPDELARLGWIEREVLDLCPDCRGEGWQIPDGALVPMHRFSGSSRLA